MNLWLIPFYSICSVYFWWLLCELIKIYDEDIL